ncbi:hypothetical protein N2152v2_010491 [Parachlorella kessleri]
MQQDVVERTINPVAQQDAPGRHDGSHDEFALNKLPRVALVIGVENYDPHQIKPLEAVHDDVDAMREMLEKEGGFKVLVSFDPDRRSLQDTLIKFDQLINSHDASGGCVAVLYYTGHALMDQKFNHCILPKDWNIGRGIAAGLEYYACKLEGRKGALSKLAGARAAVALFDISRSLASPSGVKGPQGSTPAGARAAVARKWEKQVDISRTGADNLLVAYSCEPRATAQEGARHGVFTAAILKHLCAGMTVAEAVTAIYAEVKEETGGVQLPVFSTHKPAVFARLSFAAKAVRMPEDETARKPEMAVMSTDQHVQDAAAHRSTDLESPKIEPQSAEKQAGQVVVLVRQLEGADEQLQETAARSLLDLACASPDHLPAIVASGAVPRLVDLLESLERHPQDSVVWTITNLPSVGYDKVPSLLPRDALPTLARLLDSYKNDIKEVGVWAEMVRDSTRIQAQDVKRVVKLTDVSPLHREEVARTGSVPVLVDVLHGGRSVELKRYAAKTLANLCLEAAPAASVVAAKGIPLLVKLSQDDELQTEAAQGLLNLANTSPEHLYAIAFAGGIPPLVQLLESKDKKLQGGAARLVLQLCQGSPDFQKAVVSSCAIPLLVQLLGSNGNDIWATQATAANAVGHLSHQSFGFRSVIAAAGAIPALIRLLYSTDQDVQVKAAQAVACLCGWNPRHRIGIMSAGAIPLLVQMLDAAEISVQEVAVQALAYLWTPEDQNNAASMGMASYMKELLESASQQVQDEAGRALQELSGRKWEEPFSLASASDIPGLTSLLESTNKYLQSALEIEGVLPLLVGLLGSNDKDVQEAAPAASVFAAGAIPLLARHIQGYTATDDAQAQIQAAARIVDLAYKVSHCGLVPTMSDSKRNGMQMEAERCIAELSKHGSDYRRALVSASVIAPLVELLGSVEPVVQRQAALLLPRLASKVSCRKQLEAIRDELVPLLNSSNAHVQLGAMRAVAKFWRQNPEYHGSMLCSGALARLSHQLENNQAEQVKRECALTLADLFYKDPVVMRDDIAAAMAISALLRALRSPDKCLQKYAARAVAYISGWTAFSEFRDELLAAEAITPIVELHIGPDTEAQEAANLVMKNLPCDAEYTLQHIRDR